MSKVGDFLKNAIDTVSGKTVYKRDPSLDYPEGFSSYLPEIKQAEAEYQKQFGKPIKKGVLPSILAQESSFGSNDANYNKDIGENAWLAGLTKGAAEHIKKVTGKDPDLNSVQGTLNAAAIYYGIRQTVNNYDKKLDKISVSPKTKQYEDDPIATYVERYWGGGESSKLSSDKVKEGFTRSYNTFSNLEY